jgi:hypothetical protein
VVLDVEGQQLLQHQEHKGKGHNQVLLKHRREKRKDIKKP